MEELESVKKKKGEGKGKETLFKVAFRNQITLIQIADNKANIIISINTMIISSIIAITGYGVVADKIAYDKANILIPITLIILSCLISAIFAIQAARPKLMKAKNIEEKEEKSSLLFFGVISKHSQDEYLNLINTLLTSDNDIYETMTIDLHNQGKILARKYAFLNYAYRIFMFGFILSVLAFLGFLALG
ncbi:MAG: Pycsar system effector family protein [Bacteroidota bacterium]